MTPVDGWSESALEVLERILIGKFSFMKAAVPKDNALIQEVAGLIDAWNVVNPAATVGYKASSVGLAMPLKRLRFRLETPRPRDERPPEPRMPTRGSLLTQLPESLTVS
jgi:hypothetical protein